MDFKTELSLVLRATCSLDVCQVINEPLLSSYTAYKILIFSILAYGTLNFYFYNAVLVSHLTVAFDPHKINNLEGVLLDPNIQLIQMEGYASNAYFSQPKTATAKALWQERIRNNPAAYVKDLREASDRISESKKNVLLIPVGTVNRLFETSPNPCHLTESDELIITSNVGMPFQKDSQYFKIVQTLIHRTKENGMLQKFNKGYHLFGEPSERCPENEQGSGFAPVDYHNIFTAFMVIFVGIILSGLFLCIERLIMI